MGRRSIPIEEIKDERKRHVTFGKRKTGAIKKAMELSILCNSKALLIVFDENGQLHEYCSTNDPKNILRKYLNLAHLNHEKYTNEDYFALYGPHEEKKENKQKTTRRGQIPHRTTPISHSSLITGYDFSSAGKTFAQPFPNQPVHQFLQAGQQYPIGKGKKIPNPQTPSEYLNPEYRALQSKDNKKGDEKEAMYPTIAYFGSTGFTPMPTTQETLNGHFDQKMKNRNGSEITLPSKKRKVPQQTGKIDEKDKQKKPDLTIQVPENQIHLISSPDQQDTRQNKPEQHQVQPVFLHAMSPLTPLVMPGNEDENQFRSSYVEDKDKDK